MKKTFFEELNCEETRGVAYKNINLKKELLSYFAKNNNSTIPELCKELLLSAPKVTSIISDLMDDGLVQDHGKVDSTGGRRANLYGLAPESGFFLGVDVKHYHINIGLIDFQNNPVKIIENYSYRLNNSQESLEDLCDIINNFIGELPVSKEKILGMGINLSGRINYATGYSYSFFNFQEDPLSKIIKSHIGIPVFLENDSRAMAYGEFSAGIVKEEKDVLFLNLDYGLGMGIMLNQELYYGKSGYSGEFGHFPMFQNEILCKCGKKGCLETEASGWALIEIFKKKLKEGSTTLVAKNNDTLDDITLQDIINAVLNDDVLAIELIAEIGNKLGRAVAMLINLFNPELVILGGSLATTEDYIRLPIQSSINKYSLSRVNNDTQIRISKLGNRAGIIGACLLVRDRLLTLG